MKQIIGVTLLFLFAFLPPVGGVEVQVKTETELRDRAVPNRIIIAIPAGGTFSAERMEGEWLLGVYMHSTGVSRGFIPKDAVVRPEVLAKLEEEYKERERIRIEREMLAKGFVKYEGEWVTPEKKNELEEKKFEEEMLAKGFVKFEGQWITPEQRDQIIEGRYAAEVKVLIATLKDPQATLEQREEAEKRLVGIKEPSVGPLINELKGKNRSLRGPAAVLLGKIGGEEVFDPLIAALEDEDACAGAATGLGHLRSREAVDELILALQDEDAVRAAAEALGKIGDVRAVEPLISVLQDFFEDDATHAAAAKALGSIADPKALDPLKEVMDNDKNPLVREAAREAYNKIRSTFSPEES